MNSPEKPQDGTARRRRDAMALLAEASTTDLQLHLSTLGALPEARDLRAPEIGLVMLRGRVGGTGALFNLSEATVTRAAIELASGERGFSYVLGRDFTKARLMAVVDALLQNEAQRAAVEHQVLAPLDEKIRAADRLKAQQAAATRVEFFTLVRGEDN